MDAMYIDVYTYIYIYMANNNLLLQWEHSKSEDCPQLFLKSRLHTSSLEYCQTLRVPSRGTPKIQISQRNSDFGGPLTGLICSFHVGFVMFSRLGPLQRDP